MIVLESEPIASTLRVQLEDEAGDVVIINVNYLEKPLDQCADRKGLTAALLYAESGQSVILTSFESRESLDQNELFISLMKKPNVAFLRQPAMIGDYRRVCAEFKRKNV